MKPEILSVSVEIKPRVTTLGEIIVRPDEPILLGDVVTKLRPGVSPCDLTRAVMLLIGTSFKSSARYIDGQSLKVESRALIEKSITALNPGQTLVLFPGQGAQSFWEEAALSETLCDFSTYFLPTRRVVVNGKVKGVDLSLSDSLKESQALAKNTTIVVVDDVIATGTTLQKIRSEVMKYAQRPLIFKTITWFCRNPTDVSGYEDILGVFRYSSTEGYPALNSLSTLLRGDEKSQLVLERFVRRFVRYPYGFYKQLEYLKNFLKEGAYV